MKSKAKSKILILVILGILFALLPMIAVNLTGHSNKSSEYNDDSNLDNKNLKISQATGRIEISYNSGWVAFKNDGNCTGLGTYSEPYIIEDLVIDGEGSGSCILITSSDVYFKIQNCTLYHSVVVLGPAGIEFINVRNSQLINNNCSSNYTGFYLWGCDNNTIVGNTANNGFFNDGIYLWDCDNNIISGNSFNYNYDSGINLYISDYNTISGNTANYNSAGISLKESDYNTISGNTLIGNDECITEEDCQRNTFSDNGACTYG